MSDTEETEETEEHARRPVKLILISVVGIGSLCLLCIIGAGYLVYIDSKGKVVEGDKQNNVLTTKSESTDKSDASDSIITAAITTIGNSAEGVPFDNSFNFNNSYKDNKAIQTNKDIVKIGDTFTVKGVYKLFKPYDNITISTSKGYVSNAQQTSDGHFSADIKATSLGSNIIYVSVGDRMYDAENVAIVSDDTNSETDKPISVNVMFTYAALNVGAQSRIIALSTYRDGKVELSKDPKITLDQSNLNINTPSPIITNEINNEQTIMVNTEGVQGGNNLGGTINFPF